MVSPMLARASPGDDGTLTLTYINQPVNETGIGSNNDQDLTPVDGSVSNAVLLKRGDVVGRLVNSCQYITLRKGGMGGVLQCLGTVKLAGGQITVLVRIVLVKGQTNEVKAAITGGTGDFAEAGGYVESVDIAGTMNTRVTFTSSSEPLVTFWART
jgi:hypothetical protein